MRFFSSAACKLVVLGDLRLDMFFLNLWRMHTKYNCLASKKCISAGFVNQSTHWTFYIAESMIDPGQILVSYWSDLKRNKTDCSVEKFKCKDVYGNLSTWFIDYSSEKLFWPKTNKMDWCMAYSRHKMG